ncbi:hypothetical protein EGW08_001793 [Elysia chlorotica]|uniref:CCHC-type domain-containing protein n=1 Tax=Elysia chlorotica TaxID=188477 RepID=A0A433U9H4_ELYCH|nr:hypothetical protein EGW08_001793 [Elysia chlorotica]
MLRLASVLLGQVIPGSTTLSYDTVDPRLVYLGVAVHLHHTFKTQSTMAEAAQFLFGCKAVMTSMAMAGRQSAAHAPSAPAPASVELQLILELLRSLNERMERLERQGSWQPGQTERPKDLLRRRRRTKGRSQMRCRRCRQPGNFARECRTPAPIGSTGRVVRGKAELGGKGVPVLADMGVEMSTVRQELGVDPGSSSSTIRPPTLPDRPVAPEPTVLPPERTVRSVNVVPSVASESRRRTPQLPEVNRNVPPRPMLSSQGQTLQIVNEVSPVVSRPRRRPMHLPQRRQDAKPIAFQPVVLSKDWSVV